MFASLFCHGFRATKKGLVMKLNDVRKTFLDYFESNGHKRLASAPVIPPAGDNSLLFINAGMAPLKDVFLGKDKRDYTRATSSQKCIRAGGKHNDLDNVGYTARHHTFFEMLGNFSFGDYFKEKAITYAWDLLTKEFGISPEKLLVTVYHTDDEAYDIWKKLTGFGDDKILRIPTKDNFWEMGKVGPCGPCTEIFFDHGDHVFGGKPGTKDEDGDRYMEIWNNVFMESFSDEDGNLSPLPNQNIDTGMGLERMASVMQDKHDNYDIDLFQNLMMVITDLTGQKQTAENRASFKVVSDHIRTLCFLVADGVLPGNEGRGYVMRRILRRAMRHADLLGAKEPILHLLAPALEREMGHVYPELINARESIIQTIQLEEENFARTLSSGLKILKDETKGLSKGKTLAGEVAFKLYDTYGFPLDMTQDALRSKGIHLDESGFEKAMHEQKERSRAGKSFGVGTTTETLWHDIKARVGESKFTGYTDLKGKSEIVAIVQDGKDVKEAKGFFQVIVKESPFYAESGGQAGDVGTLNGLPVSDTQKPIENLIVHTITEGSLKVGDTALLVVDSEKRQANVRAHSAAHLFQAALRDVLGPHAAQRGSAVKDDVMRFDVSHPKAMTADEILKIENFVNKAIRDNLCISTENMPKDVALSKGVVALFGEKYGDVVRVVDMGETSKELCGGTHAKHTGEIGFFKIIRESALAAGVRRIEAYTGKKSVEHVQSMEFTLGEILEQLKCPEDMAVSKIKKLQEDNKSLKSGNMDQALESMAEKFISEIQHLGNDIDFLSKTVQLDPKSLKDLVRRIFQKRLGCDFVICLISEFEDKVSAIVGVSDDLSKKKKAGDLVKLVSEKLSGQGGGGTPTLAQAGGTDISGAEAAFDALKKEIESI
ncbi:MAG: alanine--tRNA ligase [Alphaproteobacteria bacterium]|nr:alanine--tRNA ligase [Alphaproteobacteria bacterium]MBN2780099.1 alanine--tRNA ligase [Alphaproteobacteria bacterium]